MILECVLCARRFETDQLTGALDLRILPTDTPAQWGAMLTWLLPPQDSGSAGLFMQTLRVLVRSPQLRASAPKYYVGQSPNGTSGDTSGDTGAQSALGPRLRLMGPDAIRLTARGHPHVVDGLWRQ